MRALFQQHPIIASLITFIVAVLAGTADSPPQGFTEEATTILAAGDTYACFAGHIAANDTVMSHAVTDWLHIHLYFSAGNKHGCGGQPAVLDHIRLDLARDYAAYLPNSESQARWPNATDVAHFHWQEFAKYGLPPSTFGGTPFGDRTWFPWYWCPNCR